MSHIEVPSAGTLVAHSNWCWVSKVHLFFHSNTQSVHACLCVNMACRTIHLLIGSAYCLCYELSIHSRMLLIGWMLTKVTCPGYGDDTESLSVNDRPRSRRRLPLTTPLQGRCLQIAARWRPTSTARDLQGDLAKVTGEHISDHTVHRRLHHVGLHSRAHYYVLHCARKTGPLEEIGL